MHHTTTPALKGLPMTRKYIPIAAFVALAVAANVLTAQLGMVPVGLGLTATAGTWAAGLVLLARDWVHDTAGVRWVWACIAAGAVLSWAMTDSPRLAIASAIAFAISETADLLVYTPLRKRGHWFRAVLASNTVGAAVDTVVFLSIAGFGVTWGALGGQMWAKVAITLVVLLLVEAVSRGVLRYRQRAARA